MNHLLRDIAPLTPAAWAAVDAEGRQHLVAALAARKLVDVADPAGWTRSATNLGRVEPLGGAPVDGVSAGRRRVLSLVELRAPFAVGREELRAVDRGARDLDLADLDAAARRMALAENIAVFHGWPEAGIQGVAEASPHPDVPLDGDFASYPLHVAKAVELLLRAGIGGPYGMALGPDEYTGVIETTEHGGYPVFDHLRHILGGPLVWGPGVRGAVVLSLRGGDFLFDSGQDLAIGYERHDADAVHLYIEETFSFRVATPEAGVALTGEPAPRAPRRRTRRPG